MKDEFQKTIDEANQLCFHIDESHRKCIKDLIAWARAYIEPWMCPSCGKTVKVPEDRKKPRLCMGCLKEGMFPYAYLEQERMAPQLKLLLECVQHYAKTHDGEIAKYTLSQLSSVVKKPVSKQ